MKRAFRLIINPFAELDLQASVEFYELQKVDCLQKEITAKQGLRLVLSLRA